MQTPKRLIILVLIAALLLSLTACAGAPTDIMDSGADRFASGKEEDSYHLKNSGALLDELIDNYSGSYYIPGNTKMDDDAYDQAKQDPADPTDPDSTDPTDDGSAGDSLVLVRDWNDFLAVLYDTYAATSEHLEFQVAAGYSLDLSVDLQKSFTQLQREDPIYVGSVESWCWGVRGNEYVLEITYTMDVDKLIQIKDATQDLVDDAVSKIDTTGKSDYEIVCAVNDYLCDTVYYPPTEPYAPITHTAYGALNNGVAVCEGYACAAKLLLNELGIPCDIQVGTCTGGGGHAWNLVQLDGQWYQMDITWNDGSSDRDDYLLVTDDYMRKSRTWDTSEYPVCAPAPYTP